MHAIFWYKIMCSPVYEGRLLKRTALEALGNGGRQGLGSYGHVLDILDGLEDLSGESVEGITQNA